MNPKAAKPLQKLRAVQRLANSTFEDALRDEAIIRARRFIAGIKAYQHHPAVRDVPGTPIVWQEGTTKVRDYNPFQSEAPIVLVIPSLINRYDILDLDFAPSFLRTLAAQGFRPLVVDWDVPGEDEKDFSLSDYVTQRLMPVLDFAAGRGTRDEGRAKELSCPRPSSLVPSVHVLGYCMGGLLALALAALRPEQVKTLTLMATPWDFHRPDPSVGPTFKAFAEQVEPSLKALGHMPVDVIQSLFATMQPLQVLTKFTDFAGLDPNSMEARHFVLLEDWLNDGVPLTAPVARECLTDWYAENYTAKGEWHIDGVIIDPRKVTMPSYLIVPGKDKIVPPESALPLAKLLPKASLHEPMVGHIGMIASKSASHQVWAPYWHWLKEHRY